MPDLPSMKLLSMKTEFDKKEISSELIAAFLDGNTTAAETSQVLDALADDKELREIMAISMDIDNDNEFPMVSMAATYKDENICCLECEKYILKQRNIQFDEKQMLTKALDHNWLKDKGTPLFNIGRHLEEMQLAVVRKYNSTLEEISKYLNQGANIIAAVNGKKLSPYPETDTFENHIYSTSPDHAVVITSVDVEKSIINIFNPDSNPTTQSIQINDFLEAWNDSENYLVISSAPGEMEYEPSPLDLSGIELGEELDELREAIAEIAHEVWAYNRKKEGWSYGAKRDDDLKQTPDMVPYSQLPDSEKEYDREMAINTIKLIKKLGYELVKKR